MRCGHWTARPFPFFIQVSSIARQALISTKPSCESGTGPARTGDVEIDLRPECWRQHHHDQSPAYKEVCLHVVWEGDAIPEVALPTVVLKDVLDAPVDELRLWLAGSTLQEPPPNLAGQCAGPLRQLDPPTLNDLLRQAAHVRLEAKGAELEAMARQVGWGTGAVGKLVCGPRLQTERLADAPPSPSRSRSWRRPRGEPSLSALEIQARLLGASGLLPNDLGRQEPESDQYLRHIWDHWWRERERLADFVLPARLVALSRAATGQPAPTPAGTGGALAGGPPNGWGGWNRGSPRRSLMGPLAQALLARLQAPYDEYWSHHWTVKAAPIAEPQPLLGLQRATDLAVNVILPWFWIRASAGRNPDMVSRVERRYFAWPSGEDNAVLRQAPGHACSEAPASSCRERRRSNKGSSKLSVTSATARTRCAKTASFPAW